MEAKGRTFHTEDSKENKGSVRLCFLRYLL